QRDDVVPVEMACPGSACPPEPHERTDGAPTPDAGEPEIRAPHQQDQERQIRGARDRARDVPRLTWRAADPAMPVGDRSEERTQRAAVANDMAGVRVDQQNNVSAGADDNGRIRIVADGDSEWRRPMRRARGQMSEKLVHR